MSEFANPEAYELWMGRWSARLAGPFAEFTALPPGGRFLDVGCGTGALVVSILRRDPGATVVGVEPSTAYVTHCRGRIRDGRASFESGNAMALPFDDDSFDGTLALLILQEIPAPGLAVEEMRRVTRPGGRVATCQWDFADGLPMFTGFWEAVLETVDDDAHRALAARVTEVDYPDAGALRRLWEDSGLVDVEVEPLEVTMEFAGFEDYWGPFTSGVTATSSVAGNLDAEMRRILEENLRRKLLGDGRDRPFSLPARAWAVRGSVPAG
jgi:ubiquinone/menaquinone biosynthesis C-methylase UbiE